MITYCDNAGLAVGGNNIFLHCTHLWLLASHEPVVRECTYPSAQFLLLITALSGRDTLEKKRPDLSDLICD